MLAVLRANGVNRYLLTVINRYLHKQTPLMDTEEGPKDLLVHTYVWWCRSGFGPWANTLECGLQRPSAHGVTGVGGGSEIVTYANDLTLGYTLRDPGNFLPMPGRLLQKLRGP